MLPLYLMIAGAVVIAVGFAIVILVGERRTARRS